MDEIAPVVVNAPILKRLKVLDLSNGNMTDVGGQAVLNLPAGLALPGIELDPSLHDAQPRRRQLQEKLSCKVVADDPHQRDGEWHGILVSE